MNLILLDGISRHTTEEHDESLNQLQHEPETKRPKQQDASFPTGITDNNKSTSNDRSIICLNASDPRAKHIAKHLKKQPGDRIRIGLLDGGPIGEAVVMENNNDKGDPVGVVQLRILSETLRPPPKRPCVKLLLGVPFPKVVKQLWPVVTSFGVSSITYAPAELTCPEFLETSALTEKVYMPLVKEGLSQAEETRIPLVQIIKETKIQRILVPSKEKKQNAFTNVTKDDGCKIVLHIGEFPSIRKCYTHYIGVQKHAGGTVGSILLAIGPERGWTEEEVETFQAANFYLSSLGSPILRTDTAVISAISLARDVLLEHMEDLTI